MLSVAWGIVDYMREPIELSCLSCGFYFSLPREDALIARYCVRCGKSVSCVEHDLRPA
jgi:uncharacterized paraquat-inducible protein A